LRVGITKLFQKYWQPAGIAVAAHGVPGADLKFKAVASVGLADHLFHLRLGQRADRFQHPAAHIKLFIAFVEGGEQSLFNLLSITFRQLPQFGKHGKSTQAISGGSPNRILCVLQKQADQWVDQRAFFTPPEPLDGFHSHLAVGIAKAGTKDIIKVQFKIVLSKLRQPPNYLPSPRNIYARPLPPENIRLFWGEV